MKKIINNPRSVVLEMCSGIQLAHPELTFIPEYKILHREINPHKVTLISGGGSGHEPAHAGYVGEGMLDAAVCGDVFASPSQIQVYQAIRAARSPKGTLLIIKNYSGDIMNFRNGAALAREEGIEVDYVKVEDDIAVRDSLYTVGRRGVAGTVLVHKAAGAAAAEGLSLREVKAVAQRAADQVRSIGFAYSSCVVPASGMPTFEIGNDEMEYGVGIHGEPGRTREKLIHADELSKRITEQLCADLKLNEGDTATVLVNGFGGTPAQELYLFNNAVVGSLLQRGVKIHRSFAGNYMTCIDMLGASVSIMKMDDCLQKYIDAPCDAPAFRVSGSAPEIVFQPLKQNPEEREAAPMVCEAVWLEIAGEKIALNNVKAMVHKMCECVLANEVAFCKLDSYAGDGDFGMSIAKGFGEVKRRWDHVLEKGSDGIGGFLNACAFILMEYCGGASGPIWGAAFRAAALKAGQASEMSLLEFADMMQAAVKGIQATGERSFGRGAVVGDKTLIDALVPCADALSKGAEDGISVQAALQRGAKAAVDGAESTKQIVARMGRAGTVGERSLGYPDAGAFALGVLFSEIAEELVYA